jgi:hypothetical protein
MTPSRKSQPRPTTLTAGTSGRFRLHRPRRTPASLITALVALVLSGWIAWQLEQASGPPGATPTIGFSTTANSAPNAGLLVNVAVHVSQCSAPVDVTAIVAGSAQFWRLNTPDFPFTSTSRFGVALSAAGVTDLRIAPAGPYELDDPTAPRVPKRPNVEPGTFYFAHRTTRMGSMLVTTVRVNGWKFSWLPFAITFKASWTHRRDFTTCYLQLPRLIGTPSASAAAVTLVKRYGGSDYSYGIPALPLIVSYASTRVTASGRTRADLSVPPPTDLQSNYWTCATPGATSRSDLTIFPTPADISPSGTNPALSIVQVAAARAPGCDAVVVVEAPGRDVLKSILFVLVGGLAGFGLALAGDVVLRRLTRSAPS